MNFKTEILKQSTDLCFVEVVNIIFDNESLNFVNDRRILIFENTEYTPRGFSFSAPDNADGSLEIDDVDGNINYLLQTNNKIAVRIGLLEAGNPTYYVDGPYEFDVSEAVISSEGTCSLSLKYIDKLSFKLSKLTYSHKCFPGLFG